MRYVSVLDLVGLIVKFYIAMFLVHLVLGVLGGLVFMLITGDFS